MNIIICDDLYLHTCEMCIYCITPLAKGLCDTPLFLLTLKFHDLHPFLIYTPTLSVYAHLIFNCVVEMSISQLSLLSTFCCLSFSGIPTGVSS